MNAFLWSTSLPSRPNPINSRRAFPLDPLHSILSREFLNDQPHDLRISQTPALSSHREPRSISLHDGPFTTYTTCSRTSRSAPHSTIFECCLLVYHTGIHFSSLSSLVSSRLNFSSLHFLTTFMIAKRSRVLYIACSFTISDALCMSAPFTVLHLLFISSHLCLPN